MLRIGYVHENPAARRFQLERFGMRRQRDAGRLFHRAGIDDGQRTRAIADAGQTALRIGAHVVRVFQRAEFSHQHKGGSIEDLERSVITVRHPDFIGGGEIDDTRRFVQSGNATWMLPLPLQLIRLFFYPRFG